MKRNIFLCAVCALALAAACEKTPPTPENPNAGGPYAYLLNEGYWGGNNAEISRVNIADGSIEADWFSKSNGRGLGDVAQDLARYGGKLYATVYMSNVVEVIDPATGLSIKQIDFGSRGPRYMACHHGMVYVSCYDRSVVSIDTATLCISGSCAISGMQPEQLCVLGGKLYVCNSWQYGDGGSFLYDNTLSVIDLETFAETGKIEVGYNPNRIRALDGNRLVVVCAGDYDAHPAETLVLDITDNTIRQHPIAATNLEVWNGDIYCYAVAYDENWNTATAFYRNETPILQDFGGKLNDAYGISINPANGDLYISNSPYGANGDLYCITAEGVERWHTEAGNYASKVVF